MIAFAAASLAEASGLCCLGIEIEDLLNVGDHDLPPFVKWIRFAMCLLIRSILHMLCGVSRNV